MITRKLLLPAVLVGLIFTFGCSGNVKLTGKVTFSDDNSPVTTGTVRFETPTFFASGEIKPDGTYVVGTNTLTDGLPKGTYGVVVLAAETMRMETPAPRPGDPPTVSVQSRQLIDTRYASADTSGLTFVVDGRKKTFDISVDRAR